jgi:hypothetical protein
MTMQDFVHVFQMGTAWRCGVCDTREKGRNDMKVWAIGLVLLDGDHAE